VTPWPNRLQQWRLEVESAADQTELAPELIAAIMDRESLGGVALIPKGPAGTGDFGHGQQLGHGRGLMQIDDRAFPDFCAGDEWKVPARNILFGAKILARNVQAFRGDIACAVAAYNCGIHRVERLVMMHPTPSVHELDLLTTQHNYVSDVLHRLHQLQFGADGVA
jgi:soluble lytic murein transglycosylase-like protein